jgi:type IV secretory pathway TrbL component
MLKVKRKWDKDSLVFMGCLYFTIAVMWWGLTPCIKNEFDFNALVAGTFFVVVFSFIFYFFVEKKGEIVDGSANIVRKSCTKCD